MQNTNNEKGLTLIEMSVVLVIISLIMIGIFTGRDLLRASQTISVIKDLENIASALDNFREKYGYMAGDIPNAGDYWAGTWAGNGNNIIDNNDERWEVWQQLGLADMMPKDFSGAGGAGGKATPGTNIPSSQIDNGGYYMANTSYNANNDPFFSRTGNFIIVGLDSQASGNLLASPILSPKEAWDVDVKMDNGIPDSGFLYGIGLKSSGNNCVANGWDNSDAGGEYIVDNNNISCWLVYFTDGQ